MSGKSRSLYDAVYARLKELVPVTVEPEMIMTDFEIALQEGLGEIFPSATIVGCWFHFSQVSLEFQLLTTSCQCKYDFIFQNVFKYMAHLGLTNAFRENDAFKVWLKLTMALPLLPKEDITVAWNELKHQPIPGLLSSQPFRV